MNSKMEGEYDFQERFRKVLFLVKNEATAVITEMRQNKKWAPTSAVRFVVRAFGLHH